MAEFFKGSVTLSRGNEPFFDLHCQQCNRDNLHLKAYGYCQDCREYLCRDCFDNHRKPRPCRDHVLLDQHEMPKSAPSSPTNRRSSQSDKCSQKCKEHSNKTMKYYCPKHDLPVCGICVTVSHITCGVDYIPDIAKDIGESEEFIKMHRLLIDTAKKVDDTINQSQKNLADIQESYDNALTDVQALRREMNEMMDMLENKIKSEAETFKLADTDRMSSTIKQCNYLLKEMTVLRTLLEQKKDAKQECDLYTLMKTSTEKLDAFQRQAKEYIEHNDMTYYEFHRSYDTWDFINNTSAYGKLVQHRDMTQHDRIDSATHVKDISLKLKKPILSSPPTLTAMVILNEGTLVVVDGCNNNVYAIDTKTFERKFSLVLQSQVWDIARTGRASVAITAADEHKILRYTVDGGFEKEKEIRCTGRCSGVDYHKERFYVTFADMGVVSDLAILDSEGILLRKIDNGRLGNILVVPNYIAVHGDSVVVSDGVAHLIIRVDSSAKLQWVYQLSDLEMPLGLVVTHKGLILACAATSNNIHVISPDGKHVQTLLSEKDGLSKPQSLAYCESTGRLFVAQYNEDKLKVYQTH